MAIVDMNNEKSCGDSAGERVGLKRRGDRAGHYVTGLAAIAAVVAFTAPTSALAQYTVNGNSNEGAGCVGNVVISGSATYPASATGCDNTAVGIAATANAGSPSYSDTSAFGASATATGLRATALGGHSRATGDTATAVGEGAIANGVGSSVFGQGASAIGSATALGQGAIASHVGDVALGAGSVTAAANPNPGITLGGTSYGFAGVNPTSVVSVGSHGAERQITNVAAGQISQSSTDAVNGSQLFATNAEISTLFTELQGISGSAAGGVNPAIGSGASASGDNSYATGTNASASGTNSSAIGSNASASGTNSSATGSSATASGNNSTALGANTTASAANSVAVGVGSVANEENTVSVGSSSNARRITNVADGVNPTDAVNMSQLQGVRDSVSTVARRAYSGIAGAVALSMIPDVDPGKTISVGVGSGGYLGYGAVALGFTARIGSNIKIRGGASTSSSGTAYGGGASYQW